MKTFTARRRTTRLSLEPLQAREVPALLTPLTYPAGAGPSVVGDFNADGRADKVVIRTVRPGTVSTDFASTRIYLDVQLQKANGSYQTASSTLLTSALLTVNPVYQLFARDFNTDGKLDLLASYNTYSLGASSSSSVALFTGRGDGTLGSRVSLPGLKGVPSLGVGDLNGDGRLDYFACHPGLSVFLGNGDGTFHKAVSSTSLPTSLSADFNGDGWADLVVLDPSAATVAVSLGNADGSYQPAQAGFSGPNANGLTATDLDGDGDLDLLVAATTGISVLRNDGIW